MKKSIFIAGFFILFILVHFLSTIELKPVTAPESVDDLPAEEGSWEVYFCPQNNCEEALILFLASATQSIHCALYEIDLFSIQDILRKKAETIDVKIVTDNDYLKEFNEHFVTADKSGLMHNKFCVVDEQKISTGSMNPTLNDATRNNNNLLLITSTILAKNYEVEFQELWQGIFKKGEQTINQKILLNGKEIQNYFCPDDHCAERVKDELKKAQRSIHFMTFSFTHDGIANILLLKHLDGVKVKGIMDVQQIDDDSQFAKLQYQGMDVVRDSNKYKLHHKVFIIDEETVITGSFNPTNSGDKRNDENIIIIKDKEIASLFLQEFGGLYHHG